MAAICLHVLSTSFVVPPASQNWCITAPALTSIAPRMMSDGVDARHAVDSGSSTADFIGNSKGPLGHNAKKWKTQRGVVVNPASQSAKVEVDSPTAAFVAKTERNAFFDANPVEPEDESAASAVVANTGGRDAFFEEAAQTPESLAPAPRVAPPPAPPAAPAPTTSTPFSSRVGGRYQQQSRTNIAGTDAKRAVDSSSSTASFALDSSSAKGPLRLHANKWDREVREGESVAPRVPRAPPPAPTPTTSTPTSPRLQSKPGTDARRAVSTSSTESFALNSDSAKGPLRQLANKWDAERKAPAASSPASATEAATSSEESSAPPPPSAAPSFSPRTNIAGIDAKRAVDSSSNTDSFAGNAQGPSRLNSEKWDRERSPSAGTGRPAVTFGATPPIEPAEPVIEAPTKAPAKAPKTVRPAATFGATPPRVIDATEPEAPPAKAPAKAPKIVRPAATFGATPPRVIDETGPASKTPAKAPARAPANAPSAAKPAVTFGATPPLSIADAPAAAPAAAPATSTVQRIAALEFALLGDAASPQGQAPFQRIEWLDTQLGATAGTVLQRLDALEAAARAQGLI